MIWMYLKSDVISYNRKTIYGAEGERIFIINSDHHPVVLVTSEKGNSFSTTMDNLLTIKPKKNDKSNSINKR
jgi:hypothetical protein